MTQEKETKKFLLVVEHSHYDARPNAPLLLEVIKETPAYYLTPEFFPVNLRDLSLTYMKKKQVRWDKGTSKRTSDTDEFSRFRVKKVMKEIDPETAKNAIHVRAVAIAR
jgi:hypothetical protein